MSIYYISDLHLGHANAINFDNRPFANVDEMDGALIRNWNRVVSEQDTVCVLGDFIWAKENEWPSYLENLKGKKILVRGNHDPKEFSRTTKRYFQDIAPLKEITDSGKHVIMCHYPIPFHRGDYDEKCYMLYGHVHNSRENEFLLRWREEIRNSCTENRHARGQFINVGCMMSWMDYRPRTLEEIIEREAEVLHKD